MLIGFHFSKLLPYRCLSYAVILSVRIALVRRKFYEQLSCGHPKFVRVLVRVDSETFKLLLTRILHLTPHLFAAHRLAFVFVTRLANQIWCPFFFGGGDGTGQDWYLGKVNTRPPVLVDTHSLVEKIAFRTLVAFFFWLAKDIIGASDFLAQGPRGCQGLLDLE